MGKISGNYPNAGQGSDFISMELVKSWGKDGKDVTVVTAREVEMRGEHLIVLDLADSDGEPLEQSLVLNDAIVGELMGAFGDFDVEDMPGIGFNLFANKFSNGRVGKFVRAIVGNKSLTVGGDVPFPDDVPF